MQNQQNRNADKREHEQLDLSKESDYINSAVALYVEFNHSTATHPLYGDYTEKLADKMMKSDNVTVSHKDFACLVACMEFYGKFQSIAMQRHQSNADVQKHNQERKHAKKLADYFYQQFADTMPKAREMEFKRLVQAHAPLPRILKIV